MSLNPIPLTADSSDPNSPKGAVPVTVHGLESGEAVDALVNIPLRLTGMHIDPQMVEGIDLRQDVLSALRVISGALRGHEARLEALENANE